MRQGMIVVGVLVALGCHTVVHGQPAQVRRIEGHRLGGQLQFDSRTQKTTETATLTFIGTDGGPIFTVDFVAQYAGSQPTSPPLVVDVILTERTIADEAPQMTMQVDGQPLPLVARPHSPRSVVASIPFDDFVRLANADAIVEGAFETELVFGAAQLRMLRSIARRWAGQ